MRDVVTRSGRFAWALGVIVACGGTVCSATAQLQAEAFETGSVQLLDGSYLKDMQDLHTSSGSYFSSLQVDSLLYEFRNEAGLPQPVGAVDLTGRWEGDSNNFGFVRGHTTGHYLSAASRMYAITGDATYLNNVTDIVQGLGEAQTAMNNNGYLAAFPTTLFDRLENNQLAFPDAWVPYYTIHKIMAGLNDAHTHTGNQQALDIAFGMTDYFVDRVNGLPQSTVERMVKSHEWQGREFGGMNETLTDLYVKASAAGDSRAQSYLDLANVFNNRTLMNQLAAGNDVLNGIHANTHIPQAIGWARYGQVAGDQDAANAASNFWDIVVRDHTFVTGGNSYGEYFRTPGQETGTDGSLLSARTAETCNVYNMLKLTKTLFEQAPDQKYAAYAENALFNHILPSIEPNTGVTTYFMSLRPGHYKTYHSDTGACWCCAGSGLENPTYYTQMTYMHKDDKLWVNHFIPSELDWADKGITLRQTGNSLTQEQMVFTVDADQATQASLNIRIPSWAYGKVTVSINGVEYDGRVDRGGYLELDRQWQDGDQIEVHLPKKLYVRRSKDDPSMVSVYCGGVLLAGQLGTAGLPGNNQQVVNEWDYADAAVPAVPDIDVANADPNTWLRVVDEENLVFEVYDAGGATGILFKPFYDTHHVRYSVYWNLNAPKATRVWRGGGTYATWKEGLNWDVAAAPGDSIVFDGDLTTTAENDYAAGTAFGDIQFAQAAAAFRLTGNRVMLQGHVENHSTQMQTLDLDVSLTSGEHRFNTANGHIVASGRISGSGALVKAGDHDLVLTANNTYTGQTRVEGGRLMVGNGGTTGSLGAGDVTLANNATLAYNRSDDVTVSHNITGDGNLLKMGAGTLTLDNANTYTGATLIQEGTLRVGGTPADQLVFDFNAPGQAGTLTDQSGQATGFTSYLAGAASPTGDNASLDLNGGSLWISSGGAADFNGEINLSSIVAPGFTLADLGLDADADFTIAATFTDSPDARNYRQYGVHVGDSAEALLRGGYLSVNGDQLFGVNNAGGSANDSGVVITVTNAPDTGESLTVSISRTSGVFIVFANGVDVTPAAQLSELNGNPDLHLGVFALHTAGADDGFVVPLDQLVITSPGAMFAGSGEGVLPTTTTVTIASGAALDLDDFHQTIASLAGDAGGRVLLGTQRHNLLTLNADSGGSQFDGVISGQGELIKNGAATQILGGLNTYTGPTHVNAGTLVVNGSTGFGDTHVAADAMLMGGGTIRASLDVFGVVSPGNSPGVMTVEADAAFNDGSTLIIEIASISTHDQLDVGGLLMLGEGSTLEIILLEGYTPRAGDTFIIAAAQEIQGVFTKAWLPTLDGGLSFHVNYTATDIVLGVAPEPTTLGLMTLAGLAFLPRRSKGNCRL